MSSAGLSPTVARVRPAAIESNVGRLAALADGAALCAVVKADGYGHGALAAARAALAGGASWLAVATVDEALEVAEGTDSDAPVLVLSEVVPHLAAEAAALCPKRIRFTVASVAGIRALAAAAGPDHAVHLKVDTGMHRMGAVPEELEAVTQALRAAQSGLHLEGVWTHFAVADAPDDPFTAEAIGGASMRRWPGCVETACPGRCRACRQFGRAAGPPRLLPRPGPGRHRHLRRPAVARA